MLYSNRRYSKVEDIAAQELTTAVSSEVLLVGFLAITNNNVAVNNGKPVELFPCRIHGIV